MEEKRDLLLAFATRMGIVCDLLNIPPAGKNRQETLGKMFGVTQKAARKWLVGEGYPDTAKGVQIATQANISFDWLMTGRGRMEIDQTASPIKETVYAGAIPDHVGEKSFDRTLIATSPEQLAKIIATQGQERISDLLIAIGNEMKNQKKCL